MRNPEFPAAVANLVDGLATLYGDERRLVRELSEYKRAVTFMLAVCIAAGEDDEQPETWLTIAKVTQLAAQMGIGPARRVRHFVDEMRKDGHLVETQIPDDRRRFRLRPTERMLAIDREWLAVFHAPLAQLIPDDPRYLAAIAQDPDYHRRYRMASLTTLGIARETMIEHPAVDSFLHQAGGVRVLATLMQSVHLPADGWSDPGFYSLAAQCSATTRVHVRGMLRAAANAGYVEIAETPTVRVRATEVLIEDFKRWTADSLSAVDLVSVLAKAIPADPACGVQGLG